MSEPLSIFHHAFVINAWPAVYDGVMHFVLISLLVVLVIFQMWLVLVWLTRHARNGRRHKMYALLLACSTLAIVMVKSVSPHEPAQVAESSPVIHTVTGTTAAMPIRSIDAFVAAQ